MTQQLIFGQPSITRQEKKYLSLALKSTWISQGPFNLKLEHLVKKIHARKYCLSVCNGTLGIQLALMAFELKAGDEIIVPEFCYISPAHICKLMNLKIKIVKINKKNLQIDIVDLNNKISSKTKCILLIHNYGNTAELDAICNLARKRKVYILEDFSEAIFTKYKKKYTGTYGDIAVSSFHATKTITTGEGGIVLTDNKFFFNKMSSIREHGFKNRGDYTYKMIGSNFKLSNLLASIGFSQLKRYKKIINDKKNIYNCYYNNLKKIKNLKFPGSENKKNLCMWAFPLIIENKIHYKSFIKFLNAKKIPFRCSFNLLHDHKYLKIKKNNSQKPSVVLLPMNSDLEKKSLLKITNRINFFFKNLYTV
jgi:dTDP-4-amino-4,6-dideoxygalactose transaminase